VSLAHAQADTALIAAQLSRSQTGRYHDIIKKAQLARLHASAAVHQPDHVHGIEDQSFNNSSWNGDIDMVAVDQEYAGTLLVGSHSGRTGKNTLLLLIGLVEEEVGSQLLVLVARKVGLDDNVALEAETTQALDSLTLVLGNGDGLGARR